METFINMVAPLTNMNPAFVGITLGIWSFLVIAGIAAITENVVYKIKQRFQ